MAITLHSGTLHSANNNKTDYYCIPENEQEMILFNSNTLVPLQISAHRLNVNLDRELPYNQTIMTSTPPTIFTATSAYSLAGVATIGLLAYTGSKTLLPKNARWQDKTTFIWLAFDAMIHFSFEGSFLYLSTFGRSVNTSIGPFAELCKPHPHPHSQTWLLATTLTNDARTGKEYARADFRWGFSDETVVSLEILTVLGAGPLCVYILKQLVSDDPARHYWIVVLSTAELYGGWMTFCPEWLTGSPNLDTSNPLYFWVYLVFMNVM